ncbi:MAG: AfsR/SARP family transcriptional regulator, partial [Stackebrandtia sp.]
MDGVAVLVRLLGPVEAADGGGWVRAGTPKRCCVLAALALSPGEALSNEALANRVWSGSPPSSARGVIYGHIAQLRGLLERHEGLRLTRGADGYRLDLPHEQVDVFRARGLASRARAAADAGEHPRAAELWREAARLWRGPALSGVDGTWAGRIRAQLEGDHHVVAVGRCEAELALGRHAEVLSELEALAARHPLSETLAAQLMLALYRGGRVAEALARFGEMRDRLRRELGADPGEQLRDMHRRILRQDPDLA